MSMDTVTVQHHFYRMKLVGMRCARLLLLIENGWYNRRVWAPPEEGWVLEP